MFGGLPGVAFVPYLLHFGFHQTCQFRMWQIAKFGFIGDGFGASIM